MPTAKQPKKPKKSATKSAAKPTPKPEPSHIDTIKTKATAFKSRAVGALKHPKRWPELIGRFIARTSVPEIMLIATLAMARYLVNSDFSYPSEIVLNIVLLGVIVTGIFYIYRFAFKRLFPAHVAALLMSYGLYSYGTGYPSLHRLGEALIPGSATSFTNALLMTLVLGVVFGAIGFTLDRAMHHFAAFRDLPLLKFLLFVICFVFVTQLGKMGLRMWEIRDFLAYKAPAVHLQESKAAATASKPNVYYLLFDRYANDTTLKNIYNYDNSDLKDYLSDQGFVNRQDAYANYPFTMMSVSSTLSMNYHTALYDQFKDQAAGFQAAFPYRKLLDDPAVAQALQARGYSYNQISTWWDFTRKIPAADSEPTNSYRLRILGKIFWLTDLQRDIVNKSILSPLLLKGVTVGHTAIIKYDLDRNPVQNFEAQMAAVKKIAADSTTQSQPQFTFAHVLSPHDPYVFDENGNNPTYGHDRDDNGVDETVKYTNQMTYLNTRIKDLVGTIRAKDPKAVIVMQADEGPYPKQFRGTLTSKYYYDPITLPPAQMRQKFGVLASYYMPGVDSETVTQNVTASVNAFRFVLNQYAGYQVPLLPDCQFAVGDKFHLFNYQLVSGTLKNTANPTTCKQYQ